MADPINMNPDAEIPDQVNSVVEQIAPVTMQEEQTPSYKKVGESKIPVSKHLGKLWKSRRDAGLQARKPFEEAWDEAISYYNNDQMGHRKSADGQSGNSMLARRVNRNHSETENIVFATVASLVPALYAKNPTATFTPEIPESPSLGHNGGPPMEAETEQDDPDEEAIEAMADVMKRLVNTLASMQWAPGFYMKPKARQAVVCALLTNEAWAEVGYTEKDASSDKALQDLQQAALELETADGDEAIRAVEGKLQALEEKVDLLSPEGPFVRFRWGKDVVVDPDSVCPMHSDASWIMYRHMFSTAYLNAVYGERQQDGTYKSVFEPTHVLSVPKSENGIDEVVANFKLLSDDKVNPKDYGYDDDNSFRHAQRTATWVVWDKTTRRVLLFSDKNWNWPIWVWDDPYGLPGFFPLAKLAFHTAPVGARAKGETTYYLDQQDAINEMNDETRRIRQWIKRNIFYNSGTINKDDFEKVMKGDDDTGRGINLPEGTKIGDHIFVVPPPSVNYLQLFDTSSKMAAIDRIAGVSVIMRNEQFKTNTTNKAIESYTSSNQTRMDEKIDTIEDWIGVVYHMIAMLCAKFMSKEQVAAIVGKKLAEAWQQIEPREFWVRFPIRVVGGSTQKPTSAAKKQEALQMGQVLGQFVNAAPGPVLEIMLKALERAFDEVTVTKDDIEYIREVAMAQMTRGQSTSSDGGTENVAPSPEQLQQILAKLPPQAQQAFKTAVQRGVPPQDALKEIIGTLNRSQPQGSA